MSQALKTIRNDRFHVRVGAASDPGLKRAQNEDSFGCWLPEDPEDGRRRGLLLAVADGMGGARGGQVASRLAIETIGSAWRQSDGANLAGELRAALAAANLRIHGESESRPELAGMGTTCTAAVLRDGELAVAHVGDSRAYLVRGGRIRQLTHDHSLVGQLVQERQITAAQARTDPRRNVVTRSVGVGPQVEIDVEGAGEKLAPGDTLILCTDGLHGLVSDEELRVGASEPDPDSGCRTLISLARERGGPDNITVVLARVESADGAVRARPAPATARPRRSRSSKATMLLIVGASIVLLLALTAIGLLASRLLHPKRMLGAAPDVHHTGGTLT